MITVEGLYYSCSENKGADQIRGHRAGGTTIFYENLSSWVFWKHVYIGSLWKTCRSSQVGLKSVRYQHSLMSNGTRLVLVVTRVIQECSDIVHLGLPERGRVLTSQEAAQRCLNWSIDWRLVLNALATSRLEWHARSLDKLGKRNCLTMIGNDEACWGVSDFILFLAIIS